MISPDMISPDTICLSIDVEWAHPSVLADLVRLLDERGLPATFFCTGPDIIDVPGHERGIHPNFRGDGDAARAFVAQHGIDALRDQPRFYRFVIEWVLQFAPGARGVRGHSLHYDSQLLGIYRDHELVYDSSYQLPLAQGIRPCWKECGIIELPIFFNDYFELRTGATGGDPAALKLDGPGLKILNFHPNILYLNASDLPHYDSTKSFYHDPDRLLAARRTGPGTRDLFQRVLDHVVVCNLPVATLGALAQSWRDANLDPWNRSNA